ncbi:MAG: glycosyltransferase family 4 protein [Patescibacteria group bacterium]
MKILRIIYEWPPPWDGLTAHPYELTVSQSKLGHEIEIICGRWPRAGDIEQVKNVKLHPLIREPLNGLLLITVAPLVLFKYLSVSRRFKPDVVHIHGHFGLYVYLYRTFLGKFYKKSLELSVPIVSHFHNTVAGRWEASRENNIELKPLTKLVHWPLAKVSDSLAVKHASACVFVSEATKQEAIKHYNASPEKCFVVETGVNPILFSRVSQEEKEKTRKDLGLDNYDKVILNNGAMVERKNIHLLVEALKHLPIEYKLLLVGPGDPDYMYKLDTLIADNQLNHRVVKVGYTPYPNVPIAFQAADIFVLPSGWEGLPKVVMQSLACAVPTLASGFKLANPVEGLFYIQELTPETIARQIKQIVEDDPFVDSNTIALHYSWDTKAQQLEQVYQFVLNQDTNVQPQ